MAITANVTTVDKGGPQRLPWCASVYSADVSDTEEVKAAPASGNLFLEQLDILCDADSATITFLDAAAILIGPFEITSAEMNGHTKLCFIRPLKLTGALNIDQGTGGPMCVIAQGYTVL